MVDNNVLFLNARFYDSEQSDKSSPSFVDYVHVRNGRIQAVGKKGDEVWANLQADAIPAHDLQGRFVLPGFIDGHVHLLLLGQSLQKLDLFGSKDLEEIRRRIKTYARQHPNLTRIMCRGWMRSMVDGEANASMLDDLDPRPIFMDSKDLHTTWCNTTAIKELGVQSMESPKGGSIERDKHGQPTGILSEAAVYTIIWPHLARVATMEEKKTALRIAISAYTSAGYTGCCDMAMDENAWEALLELRKEEQLPLRLAAYWIISPSESHGANLAQVDRAIALNKEYNRQTSPDLCVVGIKLICDGIIDACTAHLTQPYSTDVPSPDPIWLPEFITPVIKRADENDLQCALHAIGDATVKIAIDAIEQTCSPGRRHRLEHIEISSPEDAQRLGKLGITASIQPVHSDPHILRAWSRLLGPERLKRAFAYKEFLDGGANVALGSDAPTAPHAPLQNVYVATTRKSALPGGEDAAPVNPNFALGLCESVTAATRGTAYSVFAEEQVGSLKPGLRADFVVVDMQWDPEELLKAKVVQTWFAGRKVYDVEN